MGSMLNARDAQACRHGCTNVCSDARHTPHIPNENTWVADVLARTLLEAAEAGGATAQSLGWSAGRGLDSQGHDFVDLDEFARLIEAAVSQTGDPAFGLHWGERAPFTNFGVVAVVAQSAPNARSALMGLTRFQGLLFQGRPIATFDVRGRTATLHYEVDWLPHAARRAWAEFVAAGTSGLMRQLFGRNVITLSTTFTHAAPGYTQEYLRILGSGVVFERDACCVEFEAEELERTLPQFNERVNEAATFEATRALAQIEGTERCSAQVYDQLAAQSPVVPSMDEIARKLGMSGRTLRRRLKQEGKAFPTLVAEVLRDRALQLLSDPKASVKEVAYQLGFATPNAFHRAFKRWTGGSPSEIRAGRAL
jgi:AraC-like DNA-binding protein